MEEKRSSDSKKKCDNVENSNASSVLTNPRPGSSNSNPRPGPSNPRPGPSNSVLRSGSSAASNNWQERDGDRNAGRKRLQSGNSEYEKENKSSKRETPKEVREEAVTNNQENDGPNDSSNSGSILSLDEIARASQRIAVASMQSLQQQSQQQFVHQQAIPYQTYGFGASENYHLDPNHGAYTVNPFPGMLPINSQWPAANNLPPPAITLTNGMDMVSTANSSMNAFPFMNMGSNDGSLYTLAQNLQWNSQYPVNPVDPIVPLFNIHEPIVIPNAVLTPPLPGERRTRREKPPGCKTVFVGNLPEKITEEIIRAAFGQCGSIDTVRMSKKNFCHIRFSTMEAVDQALLLSGFRMRIDDSEEPAYNGRLHVDYATARDDQHEYHCSERARLREERHRQQESFRPPSPPPIPHFSEHEAQTVADLLREKETFREGLQALIIWLDRGECTRRNSGSFYSLIQSSYSHVKRLRNDKIKYEEEVEKAKENLLNNNRAVELEINEIEKVFAAARTQKVWDHFTRSQRRKMEEMKNDTYNLKQTNSKDLIVERVEEEMELSDTEEQNNNDEEMLPEGAAEELNMLRTKVNTLNEELDNANQMLDDLKITCAEHQDEITKLRIELEESKKQEKVGSGSPDSLDNQMSFNDSATQCSPTRVEATENETQFISLISVFLHVHPFGASIDYICSYLVKIIPNINARDVESLLRRYPNVFREVCTGIGATLEKKWTYIGFKY